MEATPLVFRRTRPATEDGQKTVIADDEIIPAIDLHRLE